MIRTVTALVVAIASIGVFVVGLLVDTSGESGATVIYGLATASAVLVGALLIAKAPGNRIGPLLLLSGALLPVSVALSAYAQAGAGQMPPWPGIGIVSIAGKQALYGSIFVVLVAIPLVFPDGRLLSPRWRWLV